MLEDKEIERINETELKNLAINCYSCIKEDGKKINYMTFIKQMKNIECNYAINRIFKNIDIVQINNFIDEIENISYVRKEFYKNILKCRYEIIKNTYNNIV